MDQISGPAIEGHCSTNHYLPQTSAPLASSLLPTTKSAQRSFHVGLLPLQRDHHLQYRECDINIKPSVQMGGQPLLFTVISISLWAKESAKARFFRRVGDSLVEFKTLLPFACACSAAIESTN